MARLTVLAAVAALAAAQAPTPTSYSVDDGSCAASPAACRTFDGIGGLSGGGATSVLLPFYEEPYRSQILDYLFKPDFGASLHMLKVEIGGDAQSTDGAESSHMHDPWNENYRRGYEWWLMQEAKARNPGIKLYGLSWAFPQWVTCTPGTLQNCSDSTNNPYAYPEQLAMYETKWVGGALNTYNLSIDYLGSWNERAFNAPYLKTLRSALDEAGFGNTKVVAADSDWSIADAILQDDELAAAVHTLGAHYPGTYSSAAAEQTGKPLWASEDDSTYNNDLGAGCWARVINQNFVNGNMTASINWNLIAAYMKGTNWYRAGLMTALSPWSGAYGSQTADGAFTPGPMIWASAHTTQFTQPGWTYLPVSGSHTGSGLLAHGGSYVTLVNYAASASSPAAAVEQQQQAASGKKGRKGKKATAGAPPAPVDFTMVVEKMSRAHSSCVRPYLPEFTALPETATFQISPELLARAGNPSSLALWYTHWAFAAGDVTQEFVRLPDVPIDAQGRVVLNITVDSLYTLTTMKGAGNKGAYPQPPTPTLFPITWEDDFEACPVSSEAAYWADQNGIFECVLAGDADHGIVMQQMVPLKPVTWGGDIRPHSLIGHRDTRDASITIDALMPFPGQSVLLGVRMQGTDDSVGAIWSLDEGAQRWYLHSVMVAVNSSSLAVAQGTLPFPVTAGEWYTYSLSVQGTTLTATIDGAVVMSTNWAGVPTSGHYAIGTREYGHSTQYDNVKLSGSYFTCGNTPIAAGANISLVEGAAEVGPQPGSQWDWTPIFPGSSNGTFSLRSNPSLCLSLTLPVAANAPSWLRLAPCNSSDPAQSWAWVIDGIAPDLERVSFIVNEATGRCIDQYQQGSDIGSPVDAWPCNGGANQAFFYDFDAGEIANEWSAVALGVC